MTGLEPIIEFPPIFGMNTVDDLKTLAMGECTELVNARPGNPPEIRKGCDISIISGSDTYTIVPPAIVHTSNEGTEHVIFWVTDGTDYKLVKIKAETTRPTLTIIGTATGLVDPTFCFLKIHGALYSFCSEDSTLYEGSEAIPRHRVLYIGDEYSGCKAFNITEEVDTPTISDNLLGTTYYDNSLMHKYVTYAWSYIRRTDAEAFSASGSPIAVTTATPGAAEGPGSSASYVTKYIVEDESFVIDTTSDEESRSLAIAQGATHIRVWKSFAQSTQEDAEAATKYFVIDLPAVGPSLRAQITAIDLTSADVKVTTNAAHGLISGDVVSFCEVGGSVELNDFEDSYVITKTSDTEFTLDDTDDITITAYTSGGFVGKSMDIEDVIGPAGVARTSIVDGVVQSSFTPESGPVIVKITGHGLQTGDTVRISGKFGPFTPSAKVDDLHYWGV